MRRSLVLLATAASSAAAGALATCCWLSQPTPPLVHKLRAPLLLNGAGGQEHAYLLPAGTTLYYDRAFPEGFVRYKVYVNVGGVKLEPHATTEKFWIDPLTAFPVDRQGLAKLLEGYPLTRDELAAILKSGSLTREDIRGLLAEAGR